MKESGAVKFSYEHVVAAPIEFAGFAEMKTCREKLLRLGLIGVGDDGIGFGNLSLRVSETNAFHITGSGTGIVAKLRPANCAKVIAYDFARNWLRCEGAAVASSESLTHAAIYEAYAGAAAVIHCHSAAIWQGLRDVAPTTSAAVEYGTPEIAIEVSRLLAATEAQERKLFVMGGHEDGIIAFGSSFDEAFEALMNHAALP